MTWGFTLKDVDVTWDQNKVLSSVTVNVKLPIGTSGAYPLMGPSGEGKSTLMCVLAALKWPSTGKVAWTFPDGTSFEWGCAGSGLGQKDAEYLRRSKFGFAFQNSSLHPSLTVQENLAYPLAMLGMGWTDALTKAFEHIDDFLLAHERNQVYKEVLLKSFPSQISGGQKQRVALAQAIIHDPCVVFADEPTGQLDHRTRRQVMGTLKNWIGSKKNKLLLWVTHHHVDDLEMMGVNKLIFIERSDTGENCCHRDRQWLEEWLVKS